MGLKENIAKLKKGAVGKKVAKRMAELRKNKNWFSEMCFCLCTANCSAEAGMKVQKKVGKGLLKMRKKELKKKLKEIGYRYPNKRAEYIVEARKFSEIKKIAGKMESKKAREWLVKNVKGLGWKEASHFLRNVGRTDVAILDRHILRTMKEEKMIADVPKTLNEKKYLEIEAKLGKFAKKIRMTQGELDFYLWYLKTGKILK